MKKIPGYNFQELCERGVFNVLDVYFAEMAERASGTENTDLFLAAALVSAAIRDGNSCVDLQKMAGKPLYTAELNEKENNPPKSIPRLPVWSEWEKNLTSSDAQKVIGTDEDNTLMVLLNSKLYLRRYRHYEQTIISYLTQKTEQETPKFSAIFEQATQNIFAECNAEQIQSARNCFMHKFSILNGGPGTGKTYTMARIVALLAELHANDEKILRVFLAAPTGKAAIRMVESIHQAKQNINASPKALAQIPEKAVTIHQLLGAKYNSPYFKHNHNNTLQADMVIVDEASMIDLPIMAKLLDALPKDCRLLLIGDYKQLASVESGRVFGDLCYAALNKNSPLAGTLTTLTQNHRFNSNSDIGILSSSIDKGNAQQSWNLIQNLHTDFQLFDNDDPLWRNVGLKINPDFCALVLSGYQKLISTNDPTVALQLINQFRVLCALRKGCFGVQIQNYRIEQILAKANPDFHPDSLFYYPHQLIMIQKNMPAMHLYNGDMGIVLQNDNSKDLKAWFTNKDGADKPPRSVPVNLLPQNETAFAITIHKSQGSEFDTVAMILPPDENHKILTRELLYTGITRARKKVVLWCTETSYKQAIRSKVQRQSGLIFSKKPCG